jgi:hypothetical protein
MRDEFLMVASHELRTAFTPLIMSLKTLQRWERSGQSFRPAAMTECVELAARQGTRLTTLINELLDVARIQSGRPKLDLSVVELGAVVRVGTPLRKYFNASRSLPSRTRSRLLIESLRRTTSSRRFRVAPCKGRPLPRTRTIRPTPREKKVGYTEECALDANPILQDASAHSGAGGAHP